MWGIRFVVLGALVIFAGGVIAQKSFYPWKSRTLYVKNALPTKSSCSLQIGFRGISPGRGVCEFSDFLSTGTKVKVMPLRTGARSTVFRIEPEDGKPFRLTVIYAKRADLDRFLSAFLIVKRMIHGLPTVRCMTFAKQSLTWGSRT
jgi:hypothetical protein